MKISREGYCIVSKSRPIKFLVDGDEYDDIEDVYLTTKERCEKELEIYDVPEEFEIIKVMVTYEF